MANAEGAAEVLVFQNVVRTFPGAPPVKAVDQVSFTIRRGDFAALMGPSGSGKSTVLNLAAGLDLPTEGVVRISGVLVNELKTADLCRFRRDHLGFVFQSYNLFPVLTAVENAEYTCIIRGEKAKAAREKALESLRAVGLADKANRYPTELSGGQQQRVAVARALATNPDLILADEPTANLDSKTAMQLIELFEELNQNRKVTFLFSTHDHSLVSRVRSRYEMHDGKLKS